MIPDSSIQMRHSRRPAGPGENDLGDDGLHLEQPDNRKALVKIVMP